MPSITIPIDQVQPILSMTMCRNKGVFLGRPEGAVLVTGFDGGRTVAKGLFVTVRLRKFSPPPDAKQEEYPPLTDMTALAELCGNNPATYIG